MPQACHKLIRQTALEMANELYELAAKDNQFYKQYRDRTHFLSLAWPQLIPQARATLAEMLGRTMDEGLKTTITEALILDYSLRSGRAGLPH